MSETGAKQPLVPVVTQCLLLLQRPTLRREHQCRGRVEVV